MKLYLRTFGCRANQYDSEAVRAMVEAEGTTIVETPEDADVAVFNSCAVTADAVADLRQQVRRAARRNPALRSVVMGCAAALPGAAAAPLAELPGVRALVPGADLDSVAAAIGLQGDRVAFTTRQSGARALLRIQDGCDEHCTFCVTTLARGAHRSRSADALVNEARALAEHHGEIVLTGVHIGGWGKEHDGSLGALVERLVREVPDVRFRLTSIEATEVDERLGELLVGAPGRVAPHLHAPLQSGSDRVLRRMGRHWYTAASYVSAVERLVARAPVFALAADVITGFPGERDEDHAMTVAVARALPFTSLHVFPYSARPGTAATRLPEPVAPHVARERAAELRAIAGSKAEAHRHARAGGEADVVVVREGSAPRGLTEDYLDVALGTGAPPRAARFRATLAVRGGALRAEALEPLSR
ncbi:MAG: MiaB/RimO family radical SAM methylthiotransferase [Gemmatimonadaceae bacterium]